MSRPQTLQVVRAGAGSGKTYRLCETIAQRVVNGLDPARILATTFTRKAAAELKGRIQARLLADPSLAAEERIQKAERLELAAIGTVHSVGHLLLKRFSLQLGLSPALEVLDETGSDHALAMLLNRTSGRRWQRLGRLTYRLSLENPQAIALQLLQAKRQNQISDDAFADDLRASGEQLVQLLLNGETPITGPAMAELYALAEDARERIRACDDTTKTTKECDQVLAVLAGEHRNRWQDFLRAAKASAGKRSGADACLEELRCAGQTVRQQAGLHREIRRLLERLTVATLKLQRDYEAFKRARGMADFTDLEVLLLRALEEKRIVASLQREFDFVAVDEFQDTNPLQLAIFQKLRRVSPVNFWVGDRKQSIYGFRGTDPELVKAVWESIPGKARDTLPNNYRSQQGLVELVGELFSPAFGEEVRLKATRPGVPRGVERWVLQTRNKTLDWQAVAKGIKALQDEGARLGDMAVLVRTGREARAIASALQEAGLSALLRLPGLFSSREGQLVLAGLRLVADRRDALAAATVRHILGDPEEKTPSWICARLARLNQDQSSTEPSEAETNEVEENPHDGFAGSESPSPWPDAEDLVRLDAIEHQALSPRVVMQVVIQALGVGDCIREWDGLQQRATNLDTMVRLAADYEDEMRELGLAATLTGMIAWLERLSDEEQDETTPPYGVDAVTLLTYHKAKGLEWPIVMLVGLESPKAANMWQPKVSGVSAVAEDPLAARTLRYWPWPFGMSAFNSLTKGSDLESDALQSEEGLLASASQKAEDVRLLYVGMTRAREKLVLIHRKGQCSRLLDLTAAEEILPDGSEEGEFPLGNMSTTCVVRHLVPYSEEVRRSSSLPSERGWLAPLGQTDEVSPPAVRIQFPSAALPREGARFDQVTLGPPLTEAVLSTDPGIAVAGTPVALSGTTLGCNAIAAADLAEDHQNTEPQELGNAVHAYFAALPSISSLSVQEQEVVALRCLQGYGVGDELSGREVVDLGERLAEWIQATYPGTTWHTEVPILSPRPEGGSWTGSIDLLLALPDSSLVILDHKASRIAPDQCERAAQSYSGQLSAYREALQTQGYKVQDTWLHFPLAGVMARMHQ